MPWSVYHDGELEVQERAGVRALAHPLTDYIRTAMPTQHQEFFSSQGMFYVAARDASGQPWASVLYGRPGFMTAPDAEHLVIKAYRRLPGDPGVLSPGSHVGGLAIQPTTRRRNRVNGTLLRVGYGGEQHSHQGQQQQLEGEPPLLLHVDLSFGNCPKYIQVRDVRLRKEDLPALPTAAAAPRAPKAPRQSAGTAYTDPAAASTRATTGLGATAAASGVSRGTWQDLTPQHLHLIASADTFFIATCYQPPPGRAGGVTEAAAGCDVSHRGGPPGFVRLEADPRGGPAPTLRWADYAGNTMFMTLGNLALDPRAGLLFIDWATGSTLQLSGSAHVDHDDTSLPGAERSVRFTISSFVFVERGLPVDVRSYRPDAVQFSPYLPHDSRPPPPPQGEAWDRIGRLKGVPASPASPSGVVTAAAGVVISGAAVGQQQGGQVQQLLRDVECVAVQDAAEGIKSFTFRLPPHLGGEAVTSGQPPFLPGQHAIFEFATVRTPSGATSITSAGSHATTSLPTAAAVTSLTRQWTVTSHPTAAIPAVGIAPMEATNSVDGTQSGTPMGSNSSSSSSVSGSNSRPGTFTISVKRAGLVSSHLHDHVAPGHVLALRGFAGDFTSQLLLQEAEAEEEEEEEAEQGEEEEEKGQGVVLLMAGGIGITPLWAVLQDLAAVGQEAAAQGSGGSGGSSREGRRWRRWRRVVLLYSVRRRAEAAFLGQLRRLAEEGGEALEAGGLELQVFLYTTQEGRPPQAPNMTPAGSAAAAAAATGPSAAAATAAAATGASPLPPPRVKSVPAHRHVPYTEVSGARMGASQVAEALGPEGLAAVRAGRCTALMCGPPGFMAAAERVLVSELGLPGSHLHSESFAY